MPPTPPMPPERLLPNRLDRWLAMTEGLLENKIEGAADRDTMIRVLDLEKSIDFYEKAFGLKVADRFDFDDDLRGGKPRGDLVEVVPRVPRGVLERSAYATWTRSRGAY